ncbi:MAG: beta-galactosidase, partial [Asticcacaulis sp.]
MSSVTGDGVTNGKKAMRIVFEPRAEDLVTLKAPTVWDWSGKGDVNIAFDIKNQSVHSIQIYLVLKDKNGLSQIRSAAVASGQVTTLYALLNGYIGKIETGMRESPPAWQSNDIKLAWRGGNKTMDLANITEITFRVDSQFETKSVVIDNIRLRSNPLVDPFYLTGIVDKFGQTEKAEYPIKIHSEGELRAVADAERAQLDASAGPADRSRFGGWSKGPHLKGTGFFRTEKVDGKWWMVDPDGYLFFSNAIANVRMANLETVTGYDFTDPSVRVIDPEELTPEDSRDIIPVPKESVSTRFLASPMRREMFKWLPAYDDPLGENYGYRRTFHQGVLEHGEVFSFYKANLERRYGETTPQSYMDTWRKVTIDRMRDWGFTSFGNWIDPSFYDNQKIPYFANGWIIGDYKTLSSGFDYWSPMPDPYDPEFVRRARLTVEQIAREVKDSPWCIGVFVDNEKSWGNVDTDRHHYGIVLDGLSKSAADSPAKAHFSQMLRTKYTTIDALNAAWKTQFTGWDQFDAGAKLADINPAAKADLSDLFFDYADTYFRVVQGELKKLMPNHMYMGVRMAEWGMPEEAIRAAVKYTDVMSYNNYREGIHPDTWDFLKKLDRPTLIGEFHIGTTSDTGLYHPGLVQAVNQADRARMYEQYMETVVSNPVMVGAHWFQYIDDPVTGRAYDGENYNVGWVSNTDIPYKEMVDAA